MFEQDIGGISCNPAATRWTRAMLTMTAAVVMCVTGLLGAPYAVLQAAIHALLSLSAASEAHAAEAYHNE